MFKKVDLNKSGQPLTKEEFIQRIKTDETFSEKWGNLGPIYGQQWTKWFKYTQIHEELTPVFYKSEINQISDLINTLKTNPDNRRMLVSAWNVGDIEIMVLPPCHYAFQVYTRELTFEEREKIFLSKNPNWSFGYSTSLLDEHRIPKRSISLMWHQRSVDTFLGLPYNIASYGLLLSMIGKVVNMVPEDLIGTLGDLHLYLNHVDQAKEQILRDVKSSLPTIKFNEAKEYKSLDDFKYEDIILENYNPQSIIKAPISN